jgi:DNA-binding CsgD family transcriptional regulator
MRCPVLIGRAVEIADIAEAAKQARIGTGRVIVLTGEPGVGKTRLAQHAASFARDLGLAVAVGRAVSDGAAPPWRPISEALLQLSGDRPPPDSEALRGYVPLLAWLVPHWRTARWRVPNESIVVMAEAVLRLLREWGHAGGQLVVLEDLQWADEATIAITRYLCDHLDGLGAAIVVTAREGEGGGEIGANLERAGAIRHRLARLSGPEVDAMAAACLGEATPPVELLDRLRRDAEGLPLLVEDLLSSAGNGALPRRFADTVSLRMGRLSADHRAVIEAAAVQGRTFDWELLGPATGAPREVVSAALHHGLVLQLVSADETGYSFRHALTRDVIRDMMPIDQRRRACLAVARVLEGGTEPADLDRRATMARLLVEGGEPAAALEVLLDVGRLALRSGEVAWAVATLQRAAALASGTGHSGTAVGLEYMRALLLAGRPAEASAVGEGCIAHVDGRDREEAAEIRLLLARAAIAMEDWDTASSHIHGAGSGGGRHPGVAAEVAVLRARVDLGRSLAATRIGAEHDASQAVGIARAAKRPDLECEALEVLGLAARLRDLFAAGEALERVLIVAQEHDLPAERLRALNELGVVEMLRDATPDRLLNALSEAMRAGALGLAAGVRVNLAAVYVMTGRFDEGIAAASEVEQSAAQLGIPPLRAAAHLMLGFAMAHRCRRRDADHHLRTAVSLAPDDADLGAGAWAIGRGLMALLEEDRIGARRALDHARTAFPVVHARILNPYEGPELLLRAVAGETTTDETDKAAGSAVRGARWPALWIGAAQAVARGRCRDNVGAEEALSHALEAGARYPVFLALVQRLVGEAALRDGWTDPSPMIRSAALTFSDLGIRRAATACAGLLRSAGKPTASRRADVLLDDVLRRAGVTAREADVLELIADNLTNRQMGERLFTSPRTVEKHVAALLAKLEMPDRAALAQLARTLNLERERPELGAIYP